MQAIKEITDDLKKSIFEYMRSDGPGGMRIINAFLDEFKELSDRSPQDDPTNLKNHMPFIVKHLKETWDSSLNIADDGTISIGVCKDEVLGIEEDREKLKHNPTPIVWTVYLIRGIGGRYAFVNPQTYFLKHGSPMPPQYFGGFLINRGDWEREGWSEAVGSFEQYEHPASGASPIPFYKNILSRIDLRSIIAEAIGAAEKR